MNRLALKPCASGTITGTHDRIDGAVVLVGISRKEDVKWKKSHISG